MKWFIQERWNWIDAQLPQVSIPCNTVGIADLGIAPGISAARFVGDDLLVHLATGSTLTLDVLDARGRIIATGRLQADGSVGRIPMAGAAPGMYVARPSGPVAGAGIRVVKAE